MALTAALTALNLTAAPATARPPAGPSAGSNPSYLLTNLGTLESGTSSLALGVSASGTTVGTSCTSSSFRPQFAARWRDGQIENLGSLPGSTFSRAFAINNRGEAVGEAFTPSPEVSRAVQWDAYGTIRDLGTLGGRSGSERHRRARTGLRVELAGGRAQRGDRVGPHRPHGPSRAGPAGDRLQPGQRRQPLVARCRLRAGPDRERFVSGTGRTPDLDAHAELCHQPEVAPLLRTREQRLRVWKQGRVARADERIHAWHALGFSRVAGVHRQLDTAVLVAVRD